MRAVEDDAVLVIIDIRRILQIPAAAVDRHGNDTVILAGRVVHPSGIALVFGAESALGIAGRRRELGSRNGARVLLRLGEVDRDVQRTVGALVDPLLIARDAVAADIIRVLAEGVEPVRRPLRRNGIQAAEFGPHLVRRRCQHAHQLRIEQVARHGIILCNAAGNGVLRQFAEQVRQRQFCRGAVWVAAVELQGLKQTVARPEAVVRLNETSILRIAEQAWLMQASIMAAHLHQNATLRADGQHMAAASPRTASMPPRNSSSCSFGTKA